MLGSNLVRQLPKQKLLQNPVSQVGLNRFEHSVKPKMVLAYMIGLFRRMKNFVNLS